MRTWKEVKHTYLPLVEEMEKMGFEDYILPEVYRAAEEEISRLKEVILNAIESIKETNDG